MADPSMAVQELIEENARLKQRIRDLEQSDAERTRAEEELLQRRLRGRIRQTFRTRRRVAVVDRTRSS